MVLRERERGNKKYHLIILNHFIQSFIQLFFSGKGKQKIHIKQIRISTDNFTTTVVVIVEVLL